MTIAIQPPRSTSSCPPDTLYCFFSLTFHRVISTAETSLCVACLRANPLNTGYTMVPNSTYLTKNNETGLLVDMVWPGRPLALTWRRDHILRCISFANCHAAVSWSATSAPARQQCVAGARAAMHAGCSWWPTPRGATESCGHGSTPAVQQWKQLLPVCQTDPQACGEVSWRGIQASSED